ncbi:MAG: hypothetical protein HY716_12030 [Planctomycetes bacterium]|nr:hypothetical protein [Planctomycetota bacterium]
MRCDEFSARAAELLDRRLDAVRERDARSHASECPACAALFAKMQEEWRILARAVQLGASVHRPDPRRRRDYVSRLASPSRAFRRWALRSAGAAAAAVALWGGMRYWKADETKPAPDVAERTVQEYKTALAKSIEERLDEIAARPVVASTTLFEGALNLHTLALEEIVAKDYPPVEISPQDALDEIDSRNVARRVAAKKALFKASKNAWTQTTALEPTAKRYVRHLALWRQDAETPSEAREDAVLLIAVRADVGGLMKAMECKQFNDGVVRLMIEEGGPERPTLEVAVQSQGFSELVTVHPDLCRRVGILMEDGRTGSLGDLIRHSEAVSASMIKLMAHVAEERAEDLLDDVAPVFRDALVVELMYRRGYASTEDALAGLEVEWKRLEWEGPLIELRLRAPRDADPRVGELETAYVETRRLEIACDHLNSGLPK